MRNQVDFYLVGPGICKYIILQYLHLFLYGLLGVGGVTITLVIISALGIESVSMSEADQVRNGVLVQLPVPLHSCLGVGIPTQSNTQLKVNMYLLQFLTFLIIKFAVHIRLTFVLGTRAGVCMHEFYFYYVWMTTFTQSTNQHWCPDSVR